MYLSGKSSISSNLIKYAKMCLHGIPALSNFLQPHKAKSMPLSEINSRTLLDWFFFL
ncbi:hypothetical protein LguiA_024457 [Lonicera macranthoides]